MEDKENMMKKRESILGQNIQRMRKALSLTQEGLAAKLNVTAQAVSKWENGVSQT